MQGDWQEVTQMTGVKHIVTEWESNECYLRSDEHGGLGPGYLI